MLALALAALTAPIHAGACVAPTDASASPHDVAVAAPATTPPAPAPKCVVHAVDAFGRPVDGLALDVLVRGEDDALTDVRRDVGDDGRVELSKLPGAFVHASAAADGDWHAVRETWWLEGDDVHGLLTVVPRVPVEVRLTDADGEAIADFAAEFDTYDVVGGGNGYFVGANTVRTGGVSSDGAVRLRVPRGCASLRFWVPNSFAFSGALPIPSGMFAGGTSLLEQRITSDDLTVLAPRAPEFAVRPVRWTTDGAPVVDARWTPCDTGLWYDAAYRERMGGVTDDEGLMTVLEPLDDEGAADRYLEASLRIARDGEPDGAFVFSLPAVPEEGFEIELATEVPELALPDAPDGYAWSFVAAEVGDVQRRSSDAGAVLGHEGRRQAWAFSKDGSIAHGVLHLDAWLWGPYDRGVAFEESRGRFDLSALPACAWYVEAFDLAVDADLAYAERYHVAPIDRRGRARALAPIGPDSTLLHARAPGWCGGALSIEATDDGFAPVFEGELVTVRFVDAAGEPVPYVHFGAQWFDTFFAGEGGDGWADAEGRATVLRTPSDDGTFCVQLAPAEQLPGTVVPLELDDEGVATIVVPERGRLVVDGVAIVGGEPRHLQVRVAAGDAEDGAGDPRDRRDDFGNLTTASDGTLVMDGVPKGTYRVWVCEIDLMFDGDAPSAIVTVD